MVVERLSQGQTVCAPDYGQVHSHAAEAPRDNSRAAVTDFVGLRYQSSYAVSKYAVSKKVAAVGETASRLDCPGFCAKRFRRDVNSFLPFVEQVETHEHGE